jgi:uncharacterized protein
VKQEGLTGIISLPAILIHTAWENLPIIMTNFKPKNPSNPQKMHSEESRKSWDEIVDYCKSLAAEYRAKLVLVFGSSVKSTWTESSDVDILVISDNLPKNPIQRFFDVEQANFDVQIFGYTTRELEDMLDSLNIFVISALDEGKVIYSNPDYFAAIKNKLASIKEENKMSRSENGWTYIVPVV